MEYRMMPLGGQALCGIIEMLLATAAVWMFIRSRSLRLQKKYRMVTLCFMLFQLFLLQGTSAVRYAVGRQKEGTRLARLFGHLPVWTVSAAIMFSGLCSICLFLLLKRKEEEMITFRSIKESIDFLPDGICFGTKKGMPVLLNQQMSRLCGELTGEGLMDTEKFFKKLKDRKEKKEIRNMQTKDVLALETADKRIWDFRRRTLLLGKEEITEFTAVDVTTQYLLHQEQKERNERLNRVNERLRQFSEEVEKVTREREILAAKVKIHDEVGRSLLVLRSYLAEPCEERKRSSMLAFWQYIITVMRDGKREQEKEETLQQLQKETEALHVELVTEGLLPQRPEICRVIFCAVRECAGNTAKHAGGDRLYLTVREENGTGEDGKEGKKTVVLIRNNGNPPKGKIRETGGLKNLRRMVEKVQGYMETATVPEFVLRLEFAIFTETDVFEQR